METRSRLAHETGRTALTQLVAILSFSVAVLVIGVALWRLNGPPAMPSNVPDWQHLRSVLTGSTLASSDVMGVASTIAWITLSYLVVSTLLRIVCEVAVRFSRGAAWGQTALRLSDAITLPPVRRLAQGVLGSALIISVWLRPSGVSAAGQPPMAAIAVAPPPGQVVQVGSPPVSVDRSVEARAAAISYTVQDGDSLWTIAARFYGDGSRYTTIFDANSGRTMSTGEVFSNPSLIRPGWILDIPPDADSPAPVIGTSVYRVQDGDSLWRIAEKVLGGGLRWTDIWELNKDRDMGDGSLFVDPGRIYAGWELDLPASASLNVPPATPVPTVVPTVTVAPPITAAPTIVQPTEHPQPTSRPIPIPNSGSNGHRLPSIPTPPAEPVLAAAAGLAAVGTIALVVRRQRSHASADRPALGGHRNTAGDASRVDLATRSLLVALRELQYDNARVLLIRESERQLEFAVDCAPGDADALAGSRFAIGRRLACVVAADIVSPTRVLLKLSRFHRLAGMMIDRGLAGGSEPLLVPVGASDGSILYLNLAAGGSVLLVGPIAETSRLVTAWLTSLRTLHQPDDLGFVKGGASLPEGLSALQADESTEPEARSIAGLAADLEEVIVQRQASAAPPAPVVAFASLSDDGLADLTRLDTVLHRGPETGVFTICLAQQPIEISNMVGARVTIGDEHPDELILLIRREPPIVLQRVEVRAQPLRPSAESNPAPTRRAEPILTDSQPAHDSEPETTFAIDAEQTEDPLPESVEPLLAEAAATEREAPISVPAAVFSSRQPALMVAEAAAPTTEVAKDHTTFDVRCFGPFQVLREGNEVGGWTIQKARELLAYLIARGGTRVTREEAADALWPEEAADQVGHLLSNAAYYARKTLRGALTSPNGRLLTISEQRYQLQPGAFRVDLDAFDAHLRRAESLEGSEALIEYERALSIYRSDFLAGEPFEWAEPFRRDYQRRFVTAAQQAGRLALECRDVGKAMEFYQAILDRDPIDEEAARSVMRCHAKLGDINGVRRVYKTLRDSLKHELEDDKAEPMPETVELFGELARRTS